MHLHSIVLYSLLYAVASVQAAGTDIKMPSSFGSKTNYGDEAIKALLKDAPKTINLNTKEPPVEWAQSGNEPTCAGKITKCSTTYFGIKRTMKSIQSAEWTVKWHQDLPPRSCGGKDACVTTTTDTTTDMSSQSTGWNLQLSLGGSVVDNPPANVPGYKPQGSTGITIGYKNERTTSTSVTATVADKRSCPGQSMCYFETANVMIEVHGLCSKQAYLVCDKDYDHCADLKGCDQWTTFGNKHCTGDASKYPDEACTIQISPVDIDGFLTSLSLFEVQAVKSRRGLNATIAPAGSSSASSNIQGSASSSGSAIRSSGGAGSSSFAGSSSGSVSASSSGSASRSSSGAGPSSSAGSSSGAGSASRSSSGAGSASSSGSVSFSGSASSSGSASRSGSASSSASASHSSGSAGSASSSSAPGSASASVSRRAFGRFVARASASSSHSADASSSHSAGASGSGSASASSSAGSAETSDRTGTNKAGSYKILKVKPVWENKA